MNFLRFEYRYVVTDESYEDGKIVVSWLSKFIVFVSCKYGSIDSVLAIYQHMLVFVHDNNIGQQLDIAGLYSIYSMMSLLLIFVNLFN